MTNTLGKIALVIAAATFCVLIARSAYFASKDLNLIRAGAAQRVEASDVQTAILRVKTDLLGIESGQRGYLLTGDEAYLAPYKQAVEELPGDFSVVRSRFSKRSADERSIESELEQLAKAKIDEVEQTLRLRQKGYRHRAFLIVDSGGGKQLMDRADGLLDQLLKIESANVTRYDADLNNSVETALRQSAMAAAVLLALTVLTFLIFHQQQKRLDRTYARQSGELRATTQQLQRFTSTVANNVRPTLAEMSVQAQSLLEADGGFLPRQGQERAQWIYEASRYVNGVLDGALNPSAGANGDKRSVDQSSSSPESNHDVAEIPAERPEARSRTA